MYYSFLWRWLFQSCIIQTFFFSFCVFQLTDTVWIKSPTKTGGLEPAYLLKLLETLFDFGGATEGAWASADLRHKRQRFPRQADLFLPVMWVNLQFSFPFNSLEIRCWASVKGVWRYAKPEGVCLLLSTLGKAGWPCIIFYSCICTGGEITVSSWNGRHNDIRAWGHL